MRVIGTAGHVDHGKSTLIAALTGTHPDRLKEERAREMTIDLGFASLTMPDGEVLGIVDVPGHRDFIENMLAGVGGIDAALFVIAADEGIMPQTREHLSILDILKVQGGVIALTKIDMIDDPQWLDLVETDIQSVMSGTVLENAPIVRVSARTGAGLKELVETLHKVLSIHQPRPDLGRPRLPVDRVFTMAGFGTVVTGTLTGGSFLVGEEIEVLPTGYRGRIRGLQTHNRKESTAVPGSRTAINISGLEVTQISRGDTIAHPGTYQTSRRLDVEFHLLPGVKSPVRHDHEVKLFIGTQEVLARLRLIGSEELQPGSSGWLQLELEKPVVAQRGDRYILRRPSPGETLGGGSVLDPQPARRHKRFSDQVIHQMEAYQQGTPVEVLVQAAASSGALTIRDLVNKSGLEAVAAQEALAEAITSHQVIVLEAGEPKPGADILVASAAWVQPHQNDLDKLVREYHLINPLRAGMPREELKSKLRENARVFNALLRQETQAGRLVEIGAFVKTAEHAVSFNPEQQKRVDTVLGWFAAAPYSPPSLKDVQDHLGNEITDVLFETGKLVKVAPDVAFRDVDYNTMLTWVTQSLQNGNTLMAAQFRDRFNTSRKYALAFLEYLDTAGITLRQGDVRILKKPRGN